MRATACLFIASLVACAAINSISREEWNQVLSGDISTEFQTDEQLQEYTARLFSTNGHSHIRGDNEGATDQVESAVARERSVRRKDQFVLAIAEGHGHVTHNRIRQVITSSGGVYHPAVRGRFAVTTTDVDTIHRLHTELGSALRGVVHMRGGMKVARSMDVLGCDAEQQVHTDSVGRVGLLVMLTQMDEPSFESTVAWLRDLSDARGWGIELPKSYRPKRYSMVGLNVPCASARESALLVAELASVMWVEPRPTYQLLNRYARGITQGGDVGDTPIYKAGINGTGEIVGCSDSGIDLDHCFFEDSNCDPMDNLDTTCRKVVFYQTHPDDGADLDLNGHGTHVAGSIAGECGGGSCSGSQNRHRGMAPGARLAFIDLSASAGPSFTTPSNLDEDLFQVLYNQGAHVQAHSWGSGDFITYTAAAHEADTFMYNHPEALVLFAAGNDGDDGINTILSPAISKNVLTVGASLNARESFGNGAPSKYSEKNVAGFSSRGPTDAGLLKPDICAPGHRIMSAEAVDGNAPVCSAVHMSGTSMATPVVAGNAALAREYFRTGYYPTGERTAGNEFTPSGALLKAVMIHSAQRMTGRLYSNQALVESIDYPGYEQGYGRIQLDDVLVTPHNNYFTLIVKGDVNSNDAEFTSEGAEHHIEVQTTSNSKFRRPLVVTLVWIDEPSSLLLDTSLNNDLDLYVTHVDSNTVYNPLWPDSSTKDSVNTVEKVVINSPELSGNYTVTVRADVLTSTSQRYALVITGTFEGYDYDVKSGDSAPSAFEKLLDELNMSQNEFMIGVALIGAAVLLSCCCGRRKKRQGQRDAYHPDEVL